MSGIVVGVDASRNRSGGAIDHIIGILSAADPTEYGIKEVHLWAYAPLMNRVADLPWLVKHNPPEIEGSILSQLWWQYRSLPGELDRNKCDILFASDAGTVCPYSPKVVFSQDALSYEKGIMKHYGFTMARLRLELLYFVQNRAMKNAVGVIFLTRYAANLIQGATGRLSRTVVIPHGIDSKFHRQKPERGWSENDDRSIRCIYVSNVAMYKNQRAVVRGIRELRARGHDLELLLVGGGDGPAYRMLKEEIAASDPDRRFVKMTGFVPHDELPGLIASADIFIFASGCETISITLLEGMAVGLPIACSNRGPMPEVLEDGGVYFDPVDPDSIAAAVEKLITNGDMRVSVARRAKELSRQYTWPRCAAETWNFIRTVAGR